MGADECRAEYAMADEGVRLAEASWRNIVAWCGENAPVTAEALRGPASGDVLAAAQAETGQDWPPELLAWLRVGDGAERSLDTCLIPPSFIPMGVAHILSTWRMLIDITNQVVDQNDIRACEAGAAGSYSPAFVRSFIPVGDDTGGHFLFVDLRPGPLNGCIREWENGAAYPREPLWDGIAAMLASIDEGLRAGRWGDDHTGMEPVVEDGAVRWEDAEGWETSRA